MKAKKIFKMIQSILETHGDLVDKLHIVDITEIPSDEEFRIYHGDGYCFDCKKEEICDADEIEYYEEVDEEGNSYSTYHEWDGFKESDDDKAIELLSEYCNGVKEA